MGHENLGVVKGNKTIIFDSLNNIVNKGWFVYFMVDTLNKGPDATCKTVYIKGSIIVESWDPQEYSYQDTYGWQDSSLCIIIVTSNWMEGF